MKKQISFWAIMILMYSSAWACPVCERNQPKLLRGWTHGAGPDGGFDYFIVIAMVVIAVISLILTLRWIIKPGEKNTHHIKRYILNQEGYESEK